MTDLDDLIDATRPEDAAGRFQRRLLEEQRAHATTRRAAAKAETRIAELELLMDRFAAVKATDQRVPSWVTPKKRTRAHHATALLMLSDLHLDEVVDKLELDGMNEYDRQIAHRRLERIIDGTIELCTRYVAGVHFDGIVVALNGDIITGDLHDMAITNEAPTPATIAHWVPHLASALVHLADHFGRVHVPCTSGNHDRDPAKRRTPTQQREQSALTWIVYNWLADALRDDKRITFTISTSPTLVYPIYTTTFAQWHGDQFRSAGGVGGIFPSLLKYLHRVDSMYAAHGQRLDVHLFGHHHQYLTGRNWIGNGSLKGYDGYAKSMGFGFEPPQQALAIVTPERGIVQQMPVHAQ